MRFIQFLQKNILAVLLVVIVVGFAISKILKRKPKDKMANAGDILANEGIPETEAIVINAIARDVAHHLGTAYPWYDPRYLTENDREVFELLQPLNHDDFAMVSLLYHDVYAKGRTLANDLAKLLDDEYYQELPF